MVISPHDIFAEILLPGILLLQPYSSYEWTKERMGENLTVSQNRIDADIFKKRVLMSFGLWHRFDGLE